MALREYEMTRNGITFTALFDEKTAKEQGLKLVESPAEVSTNAKTPRNKSRRASNRGVAETHDDD